MVSHVRWDMGRYNGRVRATLNWPSVKQTSVVHIAASEYRPEIRREAPWQRFVGAANVSVTNVAPFDRGVTFYVHVDWFEPLPIMIDTTLFGRVDELLLETPDR
jgi:hypothetical protein